MEINTSAPSIPSCWFMLAMASAGPPCRQEDQTSEITVHDSASWRREHRHSEMSFYMILHVEEQYRTVIDESWGLQKKSSSFDVMAPYQLVSCSPTEWQSYYHLRLVTRHLTRFSATCSTKMASTVEVENQGPWPFWHLAGPAEPNLGHQNGPQMS